MDISVFPTVEMLESSDMVIVDIRTRPEWEETGIVPGCHCVTFFDATGSYDVEAFVKAMDALGGREREIGLICRTGARTYQVANFLVQQGYNVKNLAGGVKKLLGEGYKLVPFNANAS